MGSIQPDEIQWEKSERIAFKGNAEQEKIREGKVPEGMKIPKGKSVRLNQ